jgi:hypothetical protein
MTSELVPIGQHFTGPACGHCHCRATGIVTNHRNGTESIAVWNDPPPTCDCTCHNPWRAMHHRPVVEVAA